MLFADEGLKFKGKSLIKIFGGNHFVEKFLTKKIENEKRLKERDFPRLGNSIGF